MADFFRVLPLSRPTGVWVMCAAHGCDFSASLDILHQPDSGELIYVPLCQHHLDHPHGLEYVMETRGFFGVSQPEPEKGAR